MTTVRRSSSSVLASSKLIAFVATRDSEAARSFYEEKLGLRFVSDDKFALVFDLNGIMLRIARVQQLTPAKHTVLGWEVSDIETAVKQLREAGVEFQRYGLPGQDDEGIWTAPGGAKVAWFLDPDGNILSVSQH